MKMRLQKYYVTKCKYYVLFQAFCSMRDLKVLPKIYWEKK